MTTDPSRQIWKAGVALSDAWLHFAEQAVREEHESKPGFTGTLQHLVSVAQSTRDGKKILSALQEVGKAHLDKVESRKLLQDMLIEVLATDHLIATGYSAKGANGTPVPIAPAFFAEASADWENSVVRLNGTTYERVRITDPAALGDGFVAPVRSVETVAPVEAAPVVEPAPVVADVAPVAEAIAPVALVSKPPKKDKPPKVKAKKDAGQTSKKAKRAAKPVESAVAAPIAPTHPVEVKPEPKTPARSKVSESIHAALEKLVSVETGFSDLDRRSAAQKVRDELHATYEKGNGLSDPNLARYIRKKCGLKTARR